MNWNRFANNTPAILAGSFVPGYCQKSSGLPVSSSIGHGAAEVTGVTFPFVCFVLALCATKKPLIAFLVSEHIGRECKNFTAIVTGKLNVFHKSRSKIVSGLKSISGGLTLPVLISGLVIVWHFAVLHMPFTTTLLSTKTGRVFPVQPYTKLFSAYLASKCGHMNIIPRIAGSGTTGVACIETGRNFIGIELNPEYYETMQKRIGQAQLQMPLELPELGQPEIAYQRELISEG